LLAGPRSMRNSAIGCACLLAVFEGVGITMQRMFAQAPVVLPLSIPNEKGLKLTWNLDA
jgi:hypothetical protein